MARLFTLLLSAAGSKLHICPLFDGAASFFDLGVYASHTRDSLRAAGSLFPFSLRFRLHPPLLYEELGYSDWLWVGWHIWLLDQ